MVATLVVPLNAQDSLPLVFEENFEDGLGKWEIVDPKSWACLLYTSDAADE